MTYSKFPGMRWHPETGENQVFQSAEEVPAGWLDYHPSNPPEGVKVEEVAAAALPMTRKEITKVLSDGGIAFEKKATTEVLYALLLESLKAHLVESKVEFHETATGPELLALVPQPE